MSQHTSPPASPSQPGGRPRSGAPSPARSEAERSHPVKPGGDSPEVVVPLQGSAPPRRGRPSLAPRPLPMVLQDLDGVSAEGGGVAEEPLVITDPRISGYLEELHRGGDLLLQTMEREARSAGVPLVGPVIGALLRQLAQTLGARDIFEMGAGIGYATMFLARAVGDGGRVVHCERAAERSQRARTFLEQAGLSDRVTFEVGDVVTTLANYPGPFDLIFINMDKERYPEALELARPRVRPGGYIVAADVLLQGRVVAAGPRDEATLGVLRYTRAALAAPDLFTTLLPVGDGIALHLKLPEGKKRR